MIVRSWRAGVSVGACMAMALAFFVASDKSCLAEKRGQTRIDQGKGPLGFHQITFEQREERDFTNHSRWNILLRNKRLLMRLVFTPFEHVHDPSLQSDASVVMRVRDIDGAVQVSPPVARSRTNLKAGRKRSAIAIGMQGTGSVEADLEIGLDSRTAVAGTYCTTVNIVVTSL